MLVNHSPIIFWLIFVVAVAITHVVIIRRFKRSPNKPLWLAVRVIVAVVLLYLEVGERNLFLAGIAYLFSGWFIHNTVIAVGIGRAPWYLNKTGPLDKALGSSPWVWVIMALGFVTSLVMYFLNEVPI